MLHLIKLSVLYLLGDRASLWDSVGMSPMFSTSYMFSGGGGEDDQKYVGTIPCQAPQPPM